MASLSRYLTVRLPSSTPKKPQLTPQQHATLTDCIAQTRPNICELTRWIEQCRCNLLTVGRALNYQLSILSMPVTEDYEGLGVAVEALIRKCTPDTPAQPIIRLSLAQTAMEIKRPGSQSQRIEAEQEKVSLPLTLSPSDIERLWKRKEQPDTVLQCLVLKQAELDVEADEMVAKFLFWAEILEDLTFRGYRRQSSCNEEDAAREDTVIVGLSRITSVKRKNVAIEGILQRIATRYKKRAQTSETEILIDEMSGTSMTEVWKTGIENLTMKAEQKDQRDTKRHDSVVDVDEDGFISMGQESLEYMPPSK